MSNIAARLQAMSPERRGHTLQLPVYLEDAGLTDELHRLMSASVELSSGAAKPVQKHAGFFDRWIAPSMRSDRKAQVVDQTPISNLWYSVWHEAGDLGGFVEDLTRAWRLAERAASEHSRDTEESRDLGLEFRYALMLTSVNSLVHNFSPSLVAALIHNGMWSAEQGLTFARRTPDRIRAARTLSAIAPFLSADQWEEAALLARTLSQEGEKAEALVGLAPFSPAKLRPGFIKETLAVVRELKGNQRLELLGRLADEAGDSEALGLLEQRVYNTRGDHDTDTLKALIEMIPLLPKRIWPETLSRALSLVPKWDYFVPRHQNAAAALRNAVPFISQLDQASSGPLFERALRIAAGMDDQRGDGAVVVIAQYTPSGLVPEVHKALLACDPYTKWRGLSNLAIRLGELGDAQRGYSVAQEIQDADQQTLALSKLSAFLPKDERERLLIRATKLKYESDRVRALLAMEQHLEKRSRDWAMSVAEKAIPETVRTVFHTENAGEFFASIAPVWPERLAREAVATAVSKDASLRAKSLSGLGRVVPESVLDEIITAAAAMTNTNEITLVFDSIAPRLTRSQLQKSINALQRIGDKNERIAAAVALATWLPDQMSSEVMSFTGYENTAPVAEEEFSLLVANLLRRGRAAEAVGVVRARQKVARYSDYGFVETVENIASKIDADQLKEFVRVFREPWARHKILVASLAARNETEHRLLLHEALREARRLSSPQERTQALARIVESAKNEANSALLDELQRAAESIKGAALRWETVAPALRHLPSDWAASLTEEAIGATLSSLLSQEHEEKIFDTERTRLIKLVGKLAEAARMLECREALSACVSAVEKVKEGGARAELIQELVLHLDGEAVDKIYRLAQSITDGYWRGSAEAAIVTRMAQLGRCQEALRKARSVYFHSQKPRAIAQVAKLLPPELLAEISGDEMGHSEVAAGVAVGLAKAGLGTKALSVLSSAYDERQKLLALEEMIPSLPDDLREKAVSLALDAVREYAPRERANALVRLVAKLPCAVRLPIVLEVFSAACKVRDQQISALGKFFGQKPDEGAVLLRKIIPYVEDIPRPNLHSAWSSSLHGTSGRTREAFLLDARTLAPILATVGGPEAVKEAFEAVLNVGDWWP